MKLYFSKGACSLTVRIILNELGIKASYESVDLKNKTFGNQEDFLKINPKGSVPVLEIEQSKFLTENAVILQYLADQNPSAGLLPTLGDFQRYKVLEWLNFITTELHKGFAPLFNPKLPKEIKEAFFIPNLMNKFKFINKNLTDEYLMGEHFTLPDAYLYVILRWASNFHINISELGNLESFYARMQQRPSVKLSLEQEG